MADFNFDVKELIQRAHFDYVGPLFPLWASPKDLLPTLPNLVDVASALLFSGSPYFMTLTLKDSKGNLYEFPNEPLVTISRNTKIVETDTVGGDRDESVLEFITKKNYQLTIRGVCVDLEDKNRYPAEQVQTLIALDNLKESLIIENNFFLEQYRISKLAIKSVVYDEMMGEQGLQRYTITAISDRDFYADLNERDKINSLL